MSALIKSSILLLLAITIGVYLCELSAGEAAPPASSSPAMEATSATSDDACKQDEDRLAKLQAKPSLDEAFLFGSELRCPEVWPQLLAILDSLSHTAGSSRVSNPNGAAPDTMSAGGAAPPASSSPAMEATSATSDDACKQDEDRLAKLQAKPSLDAAVRFESELRCPEVWPQLLAILDSLSHTAGSGGVSNPNGATPDTMSAGGAAPPASSSPAMEATSATSDDACKHDEDRLAELQAKPSVDEAVRFEDELKCSKLQPQLLALLDSLSQAPQSAGALTPNEAPRNSTSAPPASESPGSEATSATSVEACKRDEDRLAELQANPTVDKATRLAREFTCIKLAPQLLAILDSLRHAAEAAPPSGPTGAGTISAGEAAPPASEPPTSEATSATSDGACKQDEDRLARLRTTPSSEEAARFAQDLRCETLRPQLLALTGALAKPSPPDSRSVSQDAGAERNATNETQPASQAVLDADRRIAALESEKEALAVEVSRLERDRESPPAEQLVPPASPQPAIPAERPDSEPASQAAADAERRIAQLESEKDALAAEVSGLQRERESPSAAQAVPPASAPPAAPAEQPESEPVAALASLPEGMPARVLIRYLANNADARAQAEKLANALAGQGVDVADLRESRSAIRTVLSFSYAPDETIAQRVGRLVGVAPVRRPQPKDALMVRPGTIEINLSGDSHLAAIKTTSTRESNHE